MSGPRFIFNTLDYQNSANSFNNFVNNSDAASNAAVTGNSFRFASHADRLKYLIGSQGQSRPSGYYDGLYANIYALTVTQNGSTLPSINGPGNSGWGRVLWSGPLLGAINIDDAFLTAKAGQADYVGIQIGGYIYSPSAGTITLQITSDDGGAVYFNNSLAINAWAYQGPTITTSAPLTLNAGYNPINILFFEGSVTCIFKFNYTITGSPNKIGLTCGCFYNYKQL